MWQYITTVFQQFRVWDIVDIAIVAFAIYKLTMLIRGTRAVQLIKGLAVLLIATLLSDWLGLNTINFLLNQVLTVGFVALPIIFYPELRRALEQLGRGKFFKTSYIQPEQLEGAIDEVVESVLYMAKRKRGALIVWEQETGLTEHAESGIEIDAKATAQLLNNIFYDKAPLHDGAVIIRGDRIVAASCYLPLSDNSKISAELGTRHRAGLGISEQSDSIVIIVSEETGAISLAKNGKLTRYLDEKTISEMLNSQLQKNNQKQTNIFPWR
ncbi:diadenylate cyclase CdaA [Proteinivorax hydrogeniformans]|uniref:Diadenylate cyclase n=1 Tax=Proteinivorax hydrogeniformans TaxID=1826727 RepID=A0AAU8HU79_9FIRM